MTTQLRNCCFWSCARRRENGKCPRENGSKQRHSSLFYSANASFRRDRATGPAHKIPDSPEPAREKPKRRTRKAEVEAAQLEQARRHAREAKKRRPSIVVTS